MTSTAGAENNDGWNTKAKESSCSLGSKSENAASGSSVTKKNIHLRSIVDVHAASLSFMLMFR